MATPNDLIPGTWTIDASHSSVSFTAKHLMISKVRGTFTGVTGTVEVLDDRLASTVSVTIDPATVSTGDANRDGHLTSNDFFDIANHPTWSFTSTAITAKGDGHVLTGDLTMRGVTKSVELAVEFDGVNQDPWGNTKAGFIAETEINRKDWGMEWNAPLETGGLLVGEKVKISLDIQLAKAA